MSAETTLKTLILSQFHSVRAFAVQAGIPYSTLDNLFRRGVQTISLPSAAELCDALNLDFRAFARGEIVVRGEEKTLYSREEADLLEQYRQLDERGRKLVRLIVQEEARAVRESGWQEQVGKPTAARGGGVTPATETDARQAEQVYQNLLKKKKGKPV